MNYGQPKLASYDFTQSKTRLFMTLSEQSAIMIGYPDKDYRRKTRPSWAQDTPPRGCYLTLILKGLDNSEATRSR